MDEQMIGNIKQRNVSKLISQSDDVVISGIGGRFPMSDSTDEFANNLYQNINMVTEDVDGQRWPKGIKHFIKFQIYIICRMTH